MDGELMRCGVGDDEERLTNATKTIIERFKALAKGKLKTFLEGQEEAKKAKKQYEKKGIYMENLPICTFGASI